MKKISRCAVALAFVLGTFLFFEIKDTITGKKEIIISRFFSWLFFSDPGYAKEMVVKQYLLDDEQVIQKLLHPEQEVQQPRNRDLYFKNVNMVLQISNQGDAAVWGTIAYRINECGNWQKLEIDIPSRKNEIKKQSFDFVIPVGVVVGFKDDKFPDDICYKWISLYTK